MLDIYFEPKYGKLYEKCENGINVNWKYDGKEGIVSHQFILRDIPIKTANKCYDIVTPYGYGGPIVDKVSDGYTREELVSSFNKSFEKYCLENNIVSEFVRFHPIFRNHQDFCSIYNPKAIRHTLGTDLKSYDDPINFEFSKNCRKNIRKALRNGLTWRITVKPDNLDDFKKIYYSTMDRNKSSEYYYFDDDYFKNCLNWFSSNMLLIEVIFDNKVIASGIYFVYNKIIHVHLSGTLTGYLYLSPSYILRYAITMWGKENGYELIHHGGGKSNASDDSLFLFKKQFAQNTEFEFFVGRKIWNQDMYYSLCEQSGANPDSDFFPAYRS